MIKRPTITEATLMVQQNGKAKVSVKDLDDTCKKGDAKYDSCMEQFYSLIGADESFSQYLTQQEGDLELSRKHMFIVLNTQGDPLAGMRIFNGSLQSDDNVDHSLESIQDYHLPMERMFFLKEIPKERFLEIVPERKLDSGSYAIFELGRTFIKPKLKMRERNFIRLIIMRYLTDYVIEQTQHYPADKISIYLHPFSQKQSRLFRGKYFMEPVAQAHDGTNYHRIRGNKMLELKESQDSLFSTLETWENL